MTLRLILRLYDQGKYNYSIIMNLLGSKIDISGLKT